MVYLIAAACVIFIAWYFFIKKDTDVYNKIPGPKMLPIIGNSMDVLVDRVKVFYLTRKWTSDYKDIFKFFAPPVKTVSIYNPEDIETVLSTLKFNEKGLIYTFLKPWLGDGLLLSQGPKWHSRRKILTPAFHFNILRHFTYILEENSWNMVNKLKQQHDEKINIVPIISEYTLHSICETAMGTKLDEKDSGDGIRYKQAIHKIGALILKRMTRVWLINSLIFKLSPTAREQNKVLKEVKSFPRRVIDERRKYRQEFGDEMYIQGTTDGDIHMNTKKKMAMLDLLLGAEKEGLINEEGIQEEVETFMFEGHDTTAMGLILIIMLLANNKDAQDKIVEECKHILGEEDRHATMSQLQEMKFLECCIKEGLRLYPPVPFISRRIGESVQLKNYTVPAGTLCNVHIFDLHRRGDLFREPFRFIPERFLTGHSAAAADSTHPYAYIPFSAGPRNCIGQKFAMLEMKSAISAILRTFELKPVTKPDEVIFAADLVLRPYNNIYVKFIRRELH